MRAAVDAALQAGLIRRRWFGIDRHVLCAQIPGLLETSPGVRSCMIEYDATVLPLSKVTHGRTQLPTAPLCAPCTTRHRNSCGGDKKRESIGRQTGDNAQHSTLCCSPAVESTLSAGHERRPTTSQPSYDEWTIQHAVLRSCWQRWTWPTRRCPR